MMDFMILFWVYPNHFFFNFRLVLTPNQKKSTNYFRYATRNSSKIKEEVFL